MVACQQSTLILESHNTVQRDTLMEGTLTNYHFKCLGGEITFDEGWAHDHDGFVKALIWGTS